jgi:hypothetical protein
MRLRGIIAVFLTIAGFITAPGSALAFNQRITVYANVPEMRIIYVSDAGFITKVGGNTSNNIEPQVYNEKSQVIPMTDAINQQYQKFLDEHQGKLQASKIYEVNPVSVDTAVNTQSIKVEQQPVVLSLSL